MKRLFSIVLGLSLAPVVGCGSGEAPLYPVHGKVTIDGAPLAGKTVKFVPDPGTPGQGSGATTNAEGAYTLLAARPGAIRDMPGTPAGTYRVVVVEPMFPVDLPVQSSENNEVNIAIGPPTLLKKKKQDIPSAYTSADTTPLRVTVPEGGGALNLALETTAKK